MKKLTVNKKEYDLITNDEKYSNLLNSLKAKIVFGDNTKKEFSFFNNITNKGKL